MTSVINNPSSQAEILKELKEHTIRSFHLAFVRTIPMIIIREVFNYTELRKNDEVTVEKDYVTKSIEGLLNGANHDFPDSRNLFLEAFAKIFLPVMGTMLKLGINAENPENLIFPLDFLGHLHEIEHQLNTEYIDPLIGIENLFIEDGVKGKDGQPFVTGPGAMRSKLEEFLQYPRVELEFYEINEKAQYASKVVIDDRSLLHQLLLYVELYHLGGPLQLPTRVIDPNLYTTRDEFHQSRDHIFRSDRKDNSKKNQKKKAGRKAKKIRDAENENIDLEENLDEELAVTQSKTEGDEEWITVIDSSLAVFEIDD